MVDPSAALRAAQRKAKFAGALICIGGPAVLLAAAGLGWIAPGTNAVEGVYQQLGYTFTGLVFLAAAWVAWRQGQVRGTFAALAPADRPRILLRESVLYAVALATSALWGALYWALVGWHASRHALAFVLLSPALFLALVPGLEAWKRAAGQEEP